MFSEFGHLDMLYKETIPSSFVSHPIVQLRSTYSWDQ